MQRGKTRTLERMNDVWGLIVEFATLTTVATVIGVAIYLRMNGEPWPLTTRIGVGLGGASVGTFAGALLLLPTSIQGWSAGLLVFLVATVASVWFQHKVHTEKFLDLL